MIHSESISPAQSNAYIFSISAVLTESQLHADQNDQQLNGDIISLSMNISGINKEDVAVVLTGIVSSMSCCILILQPFQNPNLSKKNFFH